MGRRNKKLGILVFCPIKYVMHTKNVGMAGSTHWLGSCPREQDASMIPVDYLFGVLWFKQYGYPVPNVIFATDAVPW